MPQSSASEPARYESERVAANLQFVDGIVWSRSGYLLVADVRQKKVLKFSAAPKPENFRENDAGVSGLAFDLQGRLYMCESEARRVSRFDTKGKLEPLAENYQGKKFNSPNDIAVRRDGHVYFTDPAFGTADDHRELDYYGIFHVGPKGEMDAVAQWKTRPNGIALSADGKMLYVTDSDRHVLVAFDVDKNGAASNQRDLIKGIPGVPGGIRTDTDGRFYIAAKGVAVYSPTGKLERTLLESENAANCCFGGAELDTLFVSARTNIFRVNVGVKGALQY